MAFFRDPLHKRTRGFPFGPKGKAGPTSDRKECFGIYFRNVDRDE
jgi:hypothetical protein